jgi:hypothetical protein
VVLRRPKEKPLCFPHHATPSNKTNNSPHLESADNITAAVRQRKKRLPVDLQATGFPTPLDYKITFSLNLLFCFFFAS